MFTSALGPQQMVSTTLLKNLVKQSSYRYDFLCALEKGGYGVIFSHIRQPR